MAKIPKIIPGDWVSVERAINYLGRLITSKILIEFYDVVYLGDPDEDGSWKLEKSGNNLIITTRQGGVWVTPPVEQYTG